MKLLCFIFLLLLSSTVAIAQVVVPDSITINKQWKDNNGENTLTVNVNALCNPENPPFDGHKTMIHAALKTKNFSSEVVFDDEDYQMEMILFRETDIWFFDLNKTKAAVIPFFYCGNSDTNVKASFIIFYGAKKYLYHLNFYCGEEGKCALDEKKLKGKLADLPREIKDKLIRNMKKDFTTREKFGS